MTSKKYISGLLVIPRGEGGKAYKYVVILDPNVRAKIPAVVDGNQMNDTSDERSKHLQ